MSKGGIRDQKPILTAEAVEGIAETYGINVGAIVAARLSEMVRAPPKGWVELYLDYFKERFHIPMSPFLVEVIRHYKIHVSQLTPNVVGHMIGFEVLCRSQRRACTVGLFRYFFQMKLSQDWYSCSTHSKRPELMVGFRDSIKGWKDKFFFVKKCGIKGSEGQG